MNFDLTRRLTAEALGTFILVMAVVGSGIMAEKLAGGNQAIALLCNTLADRCGPVRHHHHLRADLRRPFQSGGQPRDDAARRARSAARPLAYIAVQIVGGCLGAVAAHLMFGLDLLQFGSTARTGLGQWVGEFIATFGLVATILGCIRFKPEAVATAVGLYITSAYWFTASTSFANPAVTIARRSATRLPASRPGDVPGFIVAELLGAFAAAVCSVGCSPSREVKRSHGAGPRSKP